MRIGISGHRGLTSTVEEEVRVLLAHAVQDFDPTDLVAVSCLADGPDTWFAEAVLEHGGRLEAVVPAQRYRKALPTWHQPVYDHLLTRAADVHHTGMVESDSTAHMAGSEILVGLVDELLAVWDGQPSRGYGGTADVVAYARRTGVPVRVLWPDRASR